jgi:hypothetical protein
MEVYINDILLDLPENAGVEVVKQIAGLADLDSRQADRTNRVAALLTNRNKQALGMTNLIGGSDDSMYSQQDARVEASGFPLIQGGFARVIDVDDVANIVISSGLSSFTKLIDGQNLHDLDWSEYDHDLTTDNALDSFAHTSGYIYPVVQYGTLNTFTTTFDIRYSHAAMYLHTIVAKIVEAQGWTLAGDLLADDLYLKTVLPFSKNKFEHSQRYLDLTGFSYSLSGVQTIAGVGLDTATDEFEGLVNVMPDQWEAQTSQVIASASANVLVISLNEVEPGGSIVIPKLAIRKNGVVIATALIPFTGTIEITAASVSVVPGDLLDLAIVADYTIVGFDYASFEIQIGTANFYTGIQSKVILPGETVMAEDYLPKMNQLTLLKSVMQMWGIVPDANPVTKVITMRFFNEIEENKGTAEDWTTKLVRDDSWSGGRFYNRKEKVGNYYQNNELRYETDDLNGDPDLGVGEIVIDDTSLPDRGVLFTLPFAGSEAVAVFNSSTPCASIPFWVDNGGTWEQRLNPKPRILMIERENVSVSIEDGVPVNTLVPTTNIPFGRFIDPSAGTSLGFGQNLISRYYGGFSRAIDRGVRLSVLINMSASEFMRLNHYVPKYFSQLNGYYYIERASWRDGDFVSADIIKI